MRENFPSQKCAQKKKFARSDVRGTTAICGARPNKVQKGAWELVNQPWTSLSKFQLVDFSLQTRQAPF